MWELLGIAAVTLMIFGVVVMVWNHVDPPLQPSRPSLASRH